MLPVLRGKRQRSRCPARLRRSLRGLRGPIATHAILLFAIFYAIVLPAFSIAALLLVLPSRAVTIGGCLLTVLILGLFLSLESINGDIHPPRRRLLVGTATSFAIVGCASLVIGIVNGDALPQRSRLIAGSEIQVGKDPYRLAVGRNKTLWIGERDGKIKGIDTSLRQPIGTPVRVGNRLEDLAALENYVFAVVDRGKLVRLDPDPTAPRRLVGRRYGSSGGEIAIDGESLLVSDPASARVYRFSVDLKPIKSIQVNTRREADATAIAVDEDGFLWVLDAGLNVLYKVSLETDEVLLWKQIAGGPEALLVAGGVVYVAHPSLGFIEKREQATGRLLRRRIPIATGPTRLSSAGGLLVICNAKTDSVSPVSLKTGRRVEAALQVGAMPTDVDFGPHGGGKGWVVNRRDGNVMPLTVKSASRANGDGG